MVDENEELHEGTVAAPNRTVIIMLGVIVVLLAAIVVVVMLGNAKDDGTPQAAAPTTGAPAAPTGEQTMVAEGKTPEEHVAAYFDAVVAKDYATAFALQPADKIAGRTVESYQADVEGYGISAYTILGSGEQQGYTQVTASVTTAAIGEVKYVWSFQETAEGWVVVARDLIFE
jgi:hypothetical protein